MKLEGTVKTNSFADLVFYARGKAGLSREGLARAKQGVFFLQRGVTIFLSFSWQHLTLFFPCCKIVTTNKGKGGVA
jgi:hypothetical protein